MDDQLFERLLNEEESASLDFKQAQYPFMGATDEEKSELLKDILAFTNSWRRDAAYILIGVQEVRGGRSTPVGVAMHLQDHELQQFVNAKTNRPIDFRYIAFSYAGLQLGIITIALQARPLYLRSRYGSLEPGVVYIRRGSSTAVATPDEIASMGAASAASRGAWPALNVEWGEPQSRRLLGSVAQLEVEVLNPQIDPKTIRPPYSVVMGSTRVAKYGDDLVAYAYESRIVRPLYLVIHNRSEAPALQVRAKGEMRRMSELRFSEWLPERPGGLVPTLHFRSPLARATPDIEEHTDYWSLEIFFDTVLPGETKWSEKPVYVGSEEPRRIELPLRVMAENLPAPVKTELVVEVSTTERPMVRADLLDEQSD